MPYAAGSKIAKQPGWAEQTMKNMLSKKNQLQLENPVEEAGQSDMGKKAFWKSMFPTRDPPAYSIVSKQLAQLEEWAPACGMERSKDGLCIAKMEFIKARAARIYTQTVMRAFLSSNSCAEDGVAIAASTYIPAEKFPPPPTLRITTNALHTRDQLEEAVGVLARATAAQLAPVDVTDAPGDREASGL